MKRLFIDVETGGTNPYKHALLEIAGIVDIYGDIVEEFSFKLKPFPQDEIEDEATAVTGLTPDIIEQQHEDPGLVYIKFIKLLDSYIDKYDKKDKFTFIAYNSKFDEEFIRSFFKKKGNNFFGSYFHWPSIDVAVLASDDLGEDRPSLVNFKLITVCKYYGLDINSERFHSGDYDIALTRELYYAIKNPPKMYGGDE